MYAVIAVLFFAGALAPACAAQENCSMPCCQHKARPTSSHPGPAHAMPCCNQPTDPSSRNGSGCRYDQIHLALDPGHAPSLLALATTPSVISQEALELRSSPMAVSLAATGLVKTPIFLRTQTLLI
ncbi:MAG: hypothetical protein ACM3KE_05095 [Hyphomicrobiales bacterium]